MKTKSETQNKNTTAPKIPELQRQVTAMKERLAAAKKRVLVAKESHKRAKKTLRLAKRDAKGIRKELKVLKRSLDEATVAAISSPNKPSKKLPIAAIKPVSRPPAKAVAKTGPKAVGQATLAASPASTSVQNPPGSKTVI